MLPTQILVFIAIFEKGVKFDLGAPFVHIVRHYENQGCLGAPCTLRCAIWHLWAKLIIAQKWPFSDERDEVFNPAQEGRCKGE